MLRLSKFVLVAALVAMLAVAPVLEARPLTKDATAVTGVAHQRKLHTLYFFGEIVKFKLCAAKYILTFGIKSCKEEPKYPAPEPTPVPEYPTPVPEYPTPAPEKYTPPPPKYDRKQ